MPVLLDSNLPRAFGSLLPGHRTETTHQRGWSDLDDGPVLDVAEGTFDVFVTMDQSLRYQQNLAGRALRIIVVRAPSNRLEALAPLAPRVLRTIASMDAGALRVVTG